MLIVLLCFAFKSSLKAEAKLAGGKIGGLKRFKDDVREVEKGYECGILIEGFRGTKAGDTVLCVQKKTITRRITKPE